MNTTSEVNDSEFSLLKPQWLRDLGKDEHWLESAIIDDPSILGLGDLDLYERQRLQPSGGKLDLLLGNRSERYELELQLGTTDETHIIRTIEYWDVERRRYPNYEHTAVLVAEEISSRFFNVIYLLGYNIPIIAIKATAHEINDSIGLSFTKVLDTRDLIATTEENEFSPPPDREYWLEYLSERQLKLAETAIREITDGEPNYTKSWISSRINGKRRSRMRFLNYKSKLYLIFMLRESEEVTEKVENLTILEGIYSYGYGFFVDSEDQFNKHLPIFKKMFQLTMGEDDGIWPDEPDTHQTLNDTANSE